MALFQATFPGKMKNQVRGVIPRHGVRDVVPGRTANAAIKRVLVLENSDDYDKNDDGELSSSADDDDPLP